MCKCENQEHQEKQKSKQIESFKIPDLHKIEHEYKWTPEERENEASEIPSNTNHASIENLMSKLSNPMSEIYNEILGDIHITNNQ